MSFNKSIGRVWTFNRKQKRFQYFEFDNKLTLFILQISLRLNTNYKTYHTHYYGKK